MHLLGLRGVSQVWSAQPAWYFWIQHAVGPYHLRLESTKPLVIPSGGPGQTGLFSLRCYPYPDSPGMAAFSEEERGLVSGNWFDETNTPKFEHLGDIPLHLFQVAAVEYLVGPNDSWELIAVENVRVADIPIAEHSPEPCAHCGHDHHNQGGRKGDMRHNVSSPFLDTCISLITQWNKHKPLRVAVQASCVQEEAIPAFPSPHGKQREDQSLLTTFVLLGNPHETSHQDADSLLDRELMKDGCSILSDERFPDGSFRQVHSLASGISPVNEVWWTLAEKEFPSHLSSICGCKDCS
jgi:hypothetical protein